MLCTLAEEQRIRGRAGRIEGRVRPGKTQNLALRVGRADALLEEKNAQALERRLFDEIVETAAQQENRCLRGVNCRVSSIWMAVQT